MVILRTEFDIALYWIDKIMIAYDLQCSNGHVFEGWFEDSNAYETQKEKGLIGCPACDDTSIHRIPSTFAIKSSQPSAMASDKVTELEQMGKQIVDYVKKNYAMSALNFPKKH